MWKNYLKTALRALRQQPGTTAITIVGLAVGMAACLLIALWVQDELSYDRFHADADRTYRVLREFDIPDLQATIGTTPSALAPALEDGVAAVDLAVRVLRTAPVVERGTSTFVEPDVLRADAAFFDVFSFPTLRGEARLGQPGTVVLTEAMAAKYFPGTDPLGQTLRVGGEDLEVTAVAANAPANSHLQFDFVAPLGTTDMGWGYNNYATYVRLRDGQPAGAALAQIAEVIQPHTQARNEREAAMIGGGDAFIPHLQPITGIHLGHGVPVEIESSGNVLYVFIFAALAVFILLLAGINFVNLATARSAERAKEVGMRKTLGASRGQLVRQFLSESVLLSLGALVLALGLSSLCLPFLEQLSGKALSLGAVLGGPQALWTVALALAVGLLAGGYPAFVLSGYRPARVLKGAGRDGRGGHRLRQGLVVFQFALSIALLAGTAIVFSQLDFMQSQGLGFDQANVLLIEEVETLDGRRAAFEDEIAALPGVEGVTSGFSVPGRLFMNSMWPAMEPGGEAHNLDYSFVDFDYTDLFGIEIVAGRSLSRSLATDSFSVLINEAAARDYGWSPEEALGQTLMRDERSDRPYRVAGVTEDFHYRSLHAEVYPLVLFGPLRDPRYVAVRLAPDRVPATLEQIDARWDRFSDLPFAYSFLADNLAAQYRTEERLSALFGVFAGLAVLIGCLGLFGLAAYTAQRRTKEIGVRKVLGASVAHIVALLSKDFVVLVLVAFALAVPVAYLAMQRWLEAFAYRIDLRLGLFVLAGGLALAVALVTVGYQAARAALADPVESLRYE
ncbi:MAG: ABC transporter permease [Bacteroidota bacterium]